MANNNKEKTYWPHMILGFLVVGISLGYWTVKHAASLPVQESNEYMMKYQQADMNINEILKKKALFDKSYTIEIVNAKRAMHELENAKRAKAESTVVLTQGKNSFSYRVMNKNGSFVNDANVTFLLTRPHTIKEDQLIKSVSAREGKYAIDDITITKPGRYILQLRAQIGDTVGYSEIPAYLKP
ncbi:FixH family protein [Sulfurovum sp.]|uniref:FixH family protein n=1 Tax=Sulfurovum sp. TaxID=1969726 RepID=UPI0025D57803|nr:FixH family protein [Sulfurovum sp.]